MAKNHLFAAQQHGPVAVVFYLFNPLCDILVNHNMSLKATVSMVTLPEGYVRLRLRNCVNCVSITLLRHHHHLTGGKMFYAALARKC